MKNLFYLLCVASVLTLFSCESDDCCDIPAEDIQLHYDGDNATAPTLPPGNYNFAMRLNSSELNRVVDQNLKFVSVYIYNIPRSVLLTLMTDSGGTPGSVIYEQEVTTQLSSNEWNTIVLNSPYRIDGSPLWIGIDVSLSDLMQTVGCDAGPGAPFGDWLYDGSDDMFIRFAERVGDDINWNIRAVVGE